MADPKIKYDIEAAVKGEADADALAKTLRGVGDVLEGDLQQGALAAAQALEALGTKQRAIESFGALKRETTDLEAALTKATAQVDRLGAELPQRRTTLPTIDPALLRQLAGIGNNLNQIARKVNVAGMTPLERVQLLAALTAIGRELEGVRRDHQVP